MEISENSNLLRFEIYCSDLVLFVVFVLVSVCQWNNTWTEISVVKMIVIWKMHQEWCLELIPKNPQCDWFGEKK